MIKKLKAFTITEILVVLILTSISMLLGIQVITFIQQQFYSFNRNNTELLELTNLQSFLAEDFWSAELVQCKNGQIICRYNQYEVNYIFDKTKVIRKVSGKSNTDIIFNTPGIKIKTLFRSETINSGIIDDARLEFKIKETSYIWYFNKIYSAQQLMYDLWH